MTILLDAYGEVSKAEMKTEDGLEYPSEAFAYVGRLEPRLRLSTGDKR